MRGDPFAGAGDHDGRARRAGRRRDAVRDQRRRGDHVRRGAVQQADRPPGSYRRSSRRGAQGGLHRAGTRSSGRRRCCTWPTPMSRCSSSAFPPHRCRPRPRRARPDPSPSSPRWPVPPAPRPRPRPCAAVAPARRRWPRWGTAGRARRGRWSWWGGRRRRGLARVGSWADGRLGRGRIAVVQLRLRPWVRRGRRP